MSILNGFGVAIQASYIQHTAAEYKAMMLVENAVLEHASVFCTVSSGLDRVAAMHRDASQYKHSRQRSRYNKHVKE